VAVSSKRPPPFCQALIICDLVHSDPGTQKHFLLGTFSAIRARSFPAVHHRLGLYCELTNGHGQTHISLKLSRVRAEQIDGEPLGTIEADADFVDPRQTVTLAGNITNVTFPEPGEYRLFVEANGLLLSERKLVLMQIEPPPGLRES